MAYHILARHHSLLRQSFSATAVHCVGTKWRVSQGKAAEGQKYGPLTDLPDYSFLDGRPTPVGKGQMRRQRERQEMGAYIMRLLEEVDFARESHARKLKDKETKMLQGSKLKAKVDDDGKPFKSKSGPR